MWLEDEEATVCTRRRYSAMIAITLGISVIMITLDAVAIYIMGLEGIKDLKEMVQKDSGLSTWDSGGAYVMLGAVLLSPIVYLVLYKNLDSNMTVFLTTYHSTFQDIVTPGLDKITYVRSSKH